MKTDQKSLLVYYEAFTIATIAFILCDQLINICQYNEKSPFRR